MIRMVRVVTRGQFSIYVYVEVGQPHNLAHCHVRWADHSTQVALPTLRILVGSPLPPAARELLWDSVGQIIEEWNRLNPERVVT